MNTPTISRDDIKSFQNLARQFAQKKLSTIFEGERSDGNLEQLPEIYKAAVDIGLVSTPAPSSMGYEYGIWGTVTRHGNRLSSLLMLAAISEVCGGVAMALHVQGVASNLIRLGTHQAVKGSQAALCLIDSLYPPPMQSLVQPNDDIVSLQQLRATFNAKNQTYSLQGMARYVYSMERPELLAVFARFDHEWVCFAVSVDNPKITLEEMGLRTGLRACRMYRIAFDGVEIPDTTRLDSGKGSHLLQHALTLFWSGITAIAGGIAQGAVQAARQYASERYQGGSQIEKHSAIKGLIADAEVNREAINSMLYNCADASDDHLSDLKKAALTKLKSTELAMEAASACLQVFGGYGYMEDYGMEKRLRDAAMLKSTWGPPWYLKQLVFDLEHRSG